MVAWHAADLGHRAGRALTRSGACGAAGCAMLAKRDGIAIMDIIRFFKVR
jgi:hypothetical protein